MDWGLTDSHARFSRFKVIVRNSLFDKIYSGSEQLIRQNNSSARIDNTFCTCYLLNFGSYETAQALPIMSR